MRLPRVNPVPLPLPPHRLAQLRMNGSQTRVIQPGNRVYPTHRGIVWAKSSLKSSSWTMYAMLYAPVSQVTRLLVEAWVLIASFCILDARRSSGFVRRETRRPTGPTSCLGSRRVLCRHCKFGGSVVTGMLWNLRCGRGKPGSHRSCWPHTTGGRERSTAMADEKRKVQCSVIASITPPTHNWLRLKFSFIWMVRITALTQTLRALKMGLVHSFNISVFTPRPHMEAELSIYRQAVQRFGIAKPRLTPRALDEHTPLPFLSSHAPSPLSFLSFPRSLRLLLSTNLHFNRNTTGISSPSLLTRRVPRLPFPFLHPFRPF